MRFGFLGKGTIAVMLDNSKGALCRPSTILTTAKQDFLYQSAKMKMVAFI